MIKLFCTYMLLGVAFLTSCNKLYYLESVEQMQTETSAGGYALVDSTDDYCYTYYAEAYNWYYSPCGDGKVVYEATYWIPRTDGLGLYIYLDGTGYECEEDSCWRKHDYYRFFLGQEDDYVIIHKTK